MQTTAAHLVYRSERLGLLTEAHEIKQIDRYLTGLLGWKAATLDFISAMANGRTLLVGEGNLSFALSLARMAQIFTGRLVATTFEKEADLSPLTKNNASELRLLSVTVLHGIDATKLDTIFDGWLFDNIVFQFPNTASREPSEGRTANFVLVRDFLESASAQLAHGGRVFISAVDTSYYRGTFQFEEAAETTGFEPPEIYQFDPSAFPGYEHTTTHEGESALENHGHFSTWVFRQR